MTEAAAKNEDLSAEDLDLLDPGLEDEGKTEDELWAEADAEEAGKPAGEEPGADGDENIDDGGAAGGSGDTDVAAAQRTLDDDDAGKPAADKTKPAADDDPMAGATEAQRAAYRAALADNERFQRSIDGYKRNVAGLNRRVKELEQSAARQQKSGQPDPEEQAARRKAFSDEYPEVAEPVLAELAELRSELAELKGNQQADLADRHADQVNEQVALLEKDHSDWRDIAATDEFGDWLLAQPRHLQEAAKRNAQEIVDAAEAADVIGRFKAFRSDSGNAGNEHPDKGDAGAGDETGNQALAERRRRQRESASSARSGTPGPAQGIPEDGDEEAIWAAFDAKERREAQQARA